MDRELKKARRMTADRLKTLGERFHQEMANHISPLTSSSKWGPSTGWTLGQCVATAASWAAEKDSQQAALRGAIGRALVVPGGGKVTGVYRHRAGQVAVDAWHPLVATYPTSLPPYAALLSHYQQVIEGGRLQKWSALTPIKLIAIIHGWSPSQCREFYVPLGKVVRVGVRRVVGIRIRTSEPRSDQHTAWEVHDRFARAAKTDVFTINSGFLKAGE